MRPDTQETILNIYDSVANGDLCPDLLQQFAEQIGAIGCIVFEWRGSILQRKLGVSTASSFYHPNEIEKYIEKFSKEEARDQDLFESHSLLSD